MPRNNLLRRAFAASLLALTTVVLAPPTVASAQSVPTYESQVLGDAHLHQAARLYRSVLGREAGPEGVAYWGGLLADGFAVEEIAAHLLASQEYQNRSVGDHIVDTYQGALERAPKPEGYEFWAQFSDPTAVVVAISDSLEHQLLTDTLPPPSRTQLAHPNGWVDAGHGVFVPPILLEIRFCESRDDYRAANPRSSARGGYQFLSGSWRAYGHAARYGVSTADKATPAQQDEAALITWQADGTRPWNASRHCWG